MWQGRQRLEAIPQPIVKIGIRNSEFNVSLNDPLRKAAACPKLLEYDDERRHCLRVGKPPNATDAIAFLLNATTLQYGG